MSQQARLVSALILARLRCCNVVVLAGVTATTLASLQQVFLAAAHVILELRACDHVTPAFWELHLHWLPVIQAV